jgi:glucose-6-phosphate 1-dehydrogenase
MASTVTEATIEFARPPSLLFAATAAGRPGPNRLTFRTKPDDDIALSMQAKMPGPDMISGPTELHLQHDRARGRDAYDRLLGDALRGDAALFARQDGVMEAWRIVEPMLTSGPTVVPYPAGSWGPEAADRLLGPDWEWIVS